MLNRMITKTKEVAAKIFGCDVEDVEQAKYDHYGLQVFSYGNEEYAIGTDSEADQAVRQYIEDSLWSFRVEFILSHSKVKYSPELEKCLKQMQEKLCEGCNDLVLAIIEDTDKIVDDAVGADGRGAFLSPYDSEEQEIKIDREYFYAYRLN